MGDDVLVTILVRLVVEYGYQFRVTDDGWIELRQKPKKD